VFAARKATCRNLVAMLAIARYSLLVAERRLEKAVDPRRQRAAPTARANLCLPAEDPARCS
jgi:hypothetical protein